MDAFTQDVRHACRSIAARPGFSSLVVVILTLGLGANITLFSVVSAVLLKPLPFPAPEQLVRVYQSYPERQLVRGSLSRLDTEDWVAGSRTVAGSPTVAKLGLYSRLPANLVLTGREEPVELQTTHVSGDFFAALGVEAAHGRVLTAADEMANEPLVVLSSRCFERRFGADPTLVGSTVTLDGQPITVAGVMPPSFRFPAADVEAWVLLSRVPETAIPRLRIVRFLQGVARLAPSTTPEAAELELSAVAVRLAEQYPDSNRGASAVTVRALQDETVADARPALLALGAAMALVLLIACANVASLLLARGLARRRDFAVAAALGASRGRLLRRLLVETLLLGLLGLVAALLATVWLTEWISSWSEDLLPRAGEVGFNGGVMLFAGLTLLLTVLLAGLVPALRLSRGLGGGAGGRMGKLGRGGQGRLQGALVAGQVALALVLLAGAGLALTSLERLTRVDAGFDPTPLLAVEFSLPDHSYASDAELVALRRRILERVRAVPGVESAATIKALRLGDDGEVFRFTVVGQTPPPPGSEPVAVHYPVSAEFFRTLGVPLLSGRDFNSGDHLEAPTVGLVSEAFSRRIFGEVSPVGRRLDLGGQQVEIIGVVGNIRHRGLAADAPEALYVYDQQLVRSRMTLVARAQADPRLLTPAVVAAIREISSGQAITRAGALADTIDGTLAPPRRFAGFAALFAATALLLAACGLYGVVSFLAQERVPEIGLRMAVGAGRGEVLRLMMGRGMRWAWVGSIAGLLALGLVARLLAATLPELLFGVRAFEPTSVAAALAVLLLAAGLASYLPAHRASRLDPLVALRSEG